MNLKYFSAVFCASIFFCPSAYADQNRWLPVDVQFFSIAGVKLGMDLEQARAAAATHFKVPLKKIRTGASALSDVEMNDITQTKLPKYFNYKNTSNGESLTVSFSTRLPVDKTRPLVVESIKYMIGSSSNESKIMLKEAAREKYGAPSFTAMGMDYWCAHPNKRVFACKPREAYLLSGSGMLTLADPAYNAAANEYRMNLRTTKPNI